MRIEGGAGIKKAPWPGAKNWRPGGDFAKAVIQSLRDWNSALEHNRLSIKSGNQVVPELVNGPDICIKTNRQGLI